MALSKTCTAGPAVTILLILFLLFSTSLAAQTGLPTDVQSQSSAKQSFADQPLEEVLKRFSSEGINLLYSSNYVRPEMMIRVVPDSQNPLEQITEILEPFGLKLKPAGNSYLVVRFDSGQHAATDSSLVLIIRNSESIAELQKLQLSSEPEIQRLLRHGDGLYELFPDRPGEYWITAALPGYQLNKTQVQYSGETTGLVMLDLKKAPRGIEEVSVSASRYILFSSSEFVIDQKTIEVSPLLARDPVRAAQRLQGTAADGLSAQSHYRGGLLNESGIYLNGLKLLEPFHIRDYHSIFSTIGAQMIAGIQVYTGGFPAEYGDDMSGVMLMDSKTPAEPMHTEVGLSLFYASLLNSGHSKDQRFDWLISARRSNLQYVLNEELGEPQYFDIFTALGFNPNDSTRLTLNALYTDDEVRLVTENESSEMEQSVSDVINKTIWLTLENDWQHGMSSDTTLAYTEYSNRRVASVDDPEKLISNVNDFRNVNSLSIRNSMKFETNFGHTFKWGLEFGRQNAKYKYDGQAEYFGWVSTYPGIQNPNAYQINTKPKGNIYAAFLSDRFAATDSLSLELGVRWDKQTYTNTSDSSQISPRASALFSLGSNSELRLSAGRYYQAQQIQGMQVEDNIDHFFRPQYADQLIAGYQWTMGDYKFRVEAYYKRYEHLAPRFENLFDPLQLTPEFQFDRVMLVPESARAKGLEVSVDYAAGENFSWWASYTLSKVTDLIDGEDQRRSWDQPHAIQAGLAWQKRLWDVSVATRVHTGWPTTVLYLTYDPVTGDPQPVPGERSAKRFKTFASLDFRVSRRFSVRYGELTGFIEATNATNRSNPCCVEYGEETDSAGNLFFESNTENWLPVVPSIGLLWKF